jgi:hypothetical protein
MFIEPFWIEVFASLILLRIASSNACRAFSLPTLFQFDGPPVPRPLIPKQKIFQPKVISNQKLKIRDCIHAKWIVI